MYILMKMYNGSDLARLILPMFVAVTVSVKKVLEGLMKQTYTAKIYPESTSHQEQMMEVDSIRRLPRFSLVPSRRSS
jgi:hypothetical protein